MPTTETPIIDALDSYFRGEVSGADTIQRLEELKAPPTIIAELRVIAGIQSQSGAHEAL